MANRFTRGPGLRHDDETDSESLGGYREIGQQLSSDVKRQWKRQAHRPQAAPAEGAPASGYDDTSSMVDLVPRRLLPARDGLGSLMCERDGPLQVDKVAGSTCIK